MGQLQASGSSSPDATPPPPQFVPFPSDTSTPREDEKTTETARLPKSNNPGDLEALTKRIKELLPQPFDGCKVMIHKGLSQFFQTTHTLQLGSNIQPSKYQFGATYVGSRVLTEREFRPILMGDMSSDGSLTGMYLDHFGNWGVKCNVQSEKEKWMVYQGTVDYIGSDFTASATLANPNFFQHTGVGILHYLQSMTSNLSLGAEFLLQKVPGMEVSAFSLAGNYKGDDWEVIGKVGMHQWNLCYLHQATKNLTLVAEFEGAPMQGESMLSVGYKYDLTQANTTFRGVVNTQWNVCCIVEKRLDPLPGSVTLSAVISHVSDRARFGIGFNLG